MSSGWFCCQWLYPGRVLSHVPGKVHVTATASHPQPKVPQGQGSAMGRPEKGPRFMPAGAGPDRTGFNCLVVISELLLCAAVARVMKKIKYMGSRIFWNPEMLYLFVQYFINEEKK